MVCQIVFVSLLSLIFKVLMVSGRDPEMLLKHTNSKGHTFIKVDLLTGMKDADDYCRSQGWSLSRFTDIDEDFTLLGDLTTEKRMQSPPGCIGTWVDAIAVEPGYTFTDAKGSKFNYQFPYKHKTACWYKCCGLSVCAVIDGNTAKQRYTFEDGCAQFKHVVCNATEHFGKIPEEPHPDPEPYEEFQKRLQSKVEESRNEITQDINSTIDKRLSGANSLSGKSKEEAHKIITNGLSSVSCKDTHKDFLMDFSDLKESEKKATTDLNTLYKKSIDNLTVKKDILEEEVKSLMFQAKKKYMSQHQEDLGGDIDLMEEDKSKKVAEIKRQMKRNTSNLKKELMKHLEDEIEKMKFPSDKDLNTAVEKILSLAANQEKIKSSPVSVVWKISLGLILSLDFVLVIASVLGIRQVRLLKKMLETKQERANRFVVRFKNLNEAVENRLNNQPFDSLVSC